MFQIGIAFVLLGILPDVWRTLRLLRTRRVAASQVLGSLGGFGFGIILLLSEPPRMEAGWAWAVIAFGVLVLFAALSDLLRGAISDKAT